MFSVCESGEEKWAMKEITKFSNQQKKNRDKEKEEKRVNDEP